MFSARTDISCLQRVRGNILIMKHDIVQFHRANLADLLVIVEMLANDQLGKQREDPRSLIENEYQKAFKGIEAYTNQLLAIAEDGGSVVTTSPIITYSQPHTERIMAWTN